jgi:hypothetical protein
VAVAGLKDGGVLDATSGISYGTRIPSTNGLIPIEQLIPTQVSVASIAGARRLTDLVPSVQHIRRLRTRTGFQLAAASDQPLLTLSQAGERIWSTLKTVRPGDYVAVQRHGTVWGNSSALPRFDHEPRGNGGAFRTAPISLPTTLSVDLAYVLGLLIGDGSMRQRTSVEFTTADPSLVQAVCRVMDAMSLRVVRARRLDGYHYYVHSVVLKRWLNHLGMDNVKSEHKQIPWPILNAPQAQIRAFLQGLFDTDGSAEKRGGDVEFCSASPALAEQVHHLVLQFGIIGQLRLKPNRHAGAWILAMRGAEARKFYERVGFRLTRKQARQEALSSVSNSNIDVVPYLPPFAFTRIPRDFRMYIRRLQAPGYAKLREMATLYPELQELTVPEYFWDRVLTVQDVGYAPCIALQVAEPSTFVAHGLVCQAIS